MMREGRRNGGGELKRRKALFDGELRFVGAFVGEEKEGSGTNAPSTTKNKEKNARQQVFDLESSQFPSRSGSSLSRVWSLQKWDSSSTRVRVFNSESPSSIFLNTFFFNSLFFPFVKPKFLHPV